MARRFARKGVRGVRQLAAAAIAPARYSRTPTRLSLLGLSNILRWTKCLLPSQNNQLDTRTGPKILEKSQNMVGKVQLWGCKVGGGALLPDCNSRTSKTFPFPLATPHNSGPLRFFKKVVTKTTFLLKGSKVRCCRLCFLHLDHGSDVYTTVEVLLLVQT